MTRVITAEGMRELDAPSGQRYYAGRGDVKGYMQGGSFDMEPGDARLAVKMGGALASEAGVTRRSLGFRCPDCGFGSFLRTCSRCGGECERE